MNENEECNLRAVGAKAGFGVCRHPSLKAGVVCVCLAKGWGYEQFVDGSVSLSQVSYYHPIGAAVRGRTCMAAWTVRLWLRGALFINPAFRLGFVWLWNWALALTIMGRHGIR